MENSITNKSNSSPIISVQNISIQFENEVIINNISFQLKKGESIAITGESGKGKTSLLNALLGFVPISKGEIFLFDKKINQHNIADIRSQISWLPQETALQFSSVKDILYSLFNLKANKINTPSKNEIEHVFNCLNTSTLLLNKDFNEISGGQKQRILLASALLLKKKILIVDEPTSDLDKKNKTLITDFILSQKDLTVIAVSHDPYWIKQSKIVMNL